jgi:hypothetical protein
VQGLRDQRQRADRDADGEFRRRHAGAGENRDRCDIGLEGGGMTHGRRFSRALCKIKGDGEGRNCQSLAGAICCELF